MLGFKKVNPRDPKFTLGGDIFFTAKAAISVPIGTAWCALFRHRDNAPNHPRSELSNSIANAAKKVTELIDSAPFSGRLNCYVSTGSLTPLYNGVESSVRDLIKTVHASAGVGGSITFRTIRGFVNFGIPLTTGDCEHFSSISYGVSMFYE